MREDEIQGDARCWIALVDGFIGEMISVSMGRGHCGSTALKFCETRSFSPFSDLSLHSKECPSEGKISGWYNFNH